MSGSENVGVRTVSARVLDDLAEVLIDRVDQLLDRLTDRALAAPTPGSAVWESEWNNRETESGRARAHERSRVRAELVRRVSTDLGVVASSPPTDHLAVGEPVARRRVTTGRRRVDDAQLAFF